MHSEKSKNNIIKKKTIFIVDDDISYLRVLCKLLENNNNVYTYSNGHDAMQDLESYKPQIIILDNDMPIMSGWEMYKKFRRKLEPIKILVITSNITAIEKFQQLGVKNFLIKPFNLNCLLNIIQE